MKRSRMISFVVFQQRIFVSIFPKSEPGRLQKNYATAWKITKDIILEMVMMVMMKNACFAENLGMIDKFQEYRNKIYSMNIHNSQYLVYITTAWKITRDIILEMMMMVMMKNARFAGNLGE